ncbi:MAG TPA: oligosaccharide flippase family protein [Vicinamibacterales bacterium]
MNNGPVTSPAIPAGAARNVLLGTATKYVLLAVNIGIGAVLMPFTVEHLGVSEYGLWMLIASLTYYFQLLDLGYGNGLVRHVVDADARGDVDGVNRVLSTFVVVYAVLGLCAAISSLGLIFWAVPRFPHLSDVDIRRGQILLAIMGARIAIGFPMTVFGAVTNARQRFALNNVVAIAVAITNGIVTFLVLASGGGLVTLVTATTCVSLASYLAYAWTARRAFPSLRLRPSSFSRNLVRDVTTFSAYLFILDVAVQIGFNLDNVVVGAALGTSFVAVYAVTLRLADYQRQLCNQINGFLFPIAVRFGADGDGEALQSMLIETSRVALLMVIGVTVCVIGFARPLILRWMGPGFESGVVPLYVLAITGVVLVGQGPLGNILLGTGRHRLVACVALGEALVNLALSVVLVRRFGMLGVAIGTGAPVFAANLFILLPVACRQFRLSLWTFLRLTLAAPLAGAIPAIASCIAFRQFYPPVTLPMIVAEGGVVLLIYALSACLLGFDREARSTYYVLARRLVARPSPLIHAAPEAAS